MDLHNFSWIGFYFEIIIALDRPRNFNILTDFHYTSADFHTHMYVIDERILKEMHYTGTGDLGTIYANVRYTEAVICEVFYWNYR